MADPTRAGSKNFDPDPSLCSSDNYCQSISVHNLLFLPTGNPMLTLQVGSNYKLIIFSIFFLLSYSEGKDGLI